MRSDGSFWVGMDLRCDQATVDGTGVDHTQGDCPLADPTSGSLGTPGDHGRRGHQTRGDRLVCRDRWDRRPRQGSPFFRGALGFLAVLALAALWVTPLVAQEPLGSGSLAIRGTSLVVFPAAQTVPFDTPTEISTELAGFDTTSGELPAGLRVRADLTGPEIDGVLPLETTPGQPLRIPRLRLEGEYRVENIRLVEGDTVVQFAEPRDATVLVTQILVTRVSSRALTQDEIRSYGLVVNEDSFQGLNLTFGFAVSGRTVEYSMPLTYDLFGPGDNGLDLENVKLPEYGGGTVPSRGRFRPPQLTPFEIRLEGVVKEIPNGGCDVQHSECRKREPPAPPLVGVVLFPTDVSLLNQFFAVVLMVQNGAPEGDPLVVRDLFAKIQLPPGLRAARTEPPTPLGVPVPVRVPGPDGELGTGDDLHFLVAQAEGAAEFLVEGQREGTYLVDFEMQGVLEGLPTGPQPIFGSAKGAVVVRDPTLSVTISHPATVRNDEQYPLYLTVSNTGTAPVNQLSLRLPTSGLSGSVVVGSNEQTVESLLPGDSEVVEFQLESRRTGRVVASSVRADAGLSPRFDLQVGVGNGIPLSPESLALPSSVDELPSELVRASMALVGLGHSLATAPPDLLSSDLPRLGRAAVDERIYRLAQAGRHVHLGEDPFDSVAILTQEWLGARDRDVEWDALRRQVDKGIRFADAVADVLSAEESQPQNLFDRLAETTDFLEPGMVLVEGGGVTVEVVERGTGRIVGLDADSVRTRDLPFGEILDLDTAKLALLAAPDTAGHRLRLRIPGGGATSVRLTTRDPNGNLRALQWTGVALAPSSVAWLDFGAEGDALRLLVDDDGDGDSERDLGAAGTTVLSPRPFAAVSAVQNVVVDPSGHVVDVLFTQDVEVSSLVPRNPGHFVVPGKVSNGGLIPTEADIVESLLAGGTVHENPFEGLFNTRVVRVVFDNPLSPYVVNPLTVHDLDGTRGARITSQTLPQVVTNAVHEGIQVTGTVFGPDGQPVPFAEVQLWERDLAGTEPNAICTRHVTAATLADAEGRYHFDYVRKGDCGEVFEVEGIDRQRPNKGTARGRIRFIGQTQTLDVRMVGRGSVNGQITFADGSVPDDLRVVVYHPILDEGRRAHVGQDGRFEAANIAVGTLNLAANDSEGNFLYATFEMPRAGASVEKNLVMVRQPEAPRAEVRGTVLALADDTPLLDAYVALYVDGVQIGVQRSGIDGRFDFGIVPAGTAVLEAFDGTSGRQGDQLTLTLAPDQVQDVTLRLRDDRGAVEGNVFLRKIDGSTVPLEDVVVFINGLPHNTTTDANGFYRLEDVFAGNWQVVAASLDLVERVGDQVTITSAGGTQTRDLYFQEQLPSGGITGQILDYDGQPVQNATIHLSGDYYSVDWHHQASSGADGRFVIADLDPGVYGVHAYRGADGAIGFAEVRFPGDTPSVTVQFRKATVSGRTFYVDPATGEEIGVISQVVYRHTQVVDEWGVVALAPGFSNLQTDGDGNFTIPDVLVGPYELYVYNAFHGNQRFRGFIEDQNDDRYHAVEFTPNGTVTGVVYDWDGTTPVQGARVSMTGGQFGEFDLLTDADGRFTFELVPPGNHYTLTVDTDDGLIFRKQRLGVQLSRPGQEVDVEVILPRQGSVQGLVQTAPDADGVSLPVPGAVVTLREGGYPWRTLVHNADENGIFAFENIFEGDITLEAQAPSLGGLGGRVVDEIHTEAQEVVAFIELEPVAEIAVRVLSPETGDVVPGARLELSRTAFYDTLSSDEEGSARFRLLPLGNYRVSVFDPNTGRRGLSAWIELEAGNQRAEVDIILEIRGDVGGRLTDGNDGAELPGRVIKLRSQGLRWFSTYATTGVDGQFLFEGIPQGDFSLETRGPQRRRWARAQGFLDTEDELVTLDLVLEQTGRVSGRVLNPPGLPAGPWEQSEVNVWLDQGSWVVGASLDNPYTFDGVVADSRFVLRAQERGGLHRAVTSDVLTVEGGEKTVDLQLRALGSAQVSVFDSNGQPVPGASVSVHNGHEFAFGGSRFNASTGSDHQVLFEDIREGTLWARATDPASGLKGSVSGRLSLEGEVADLQIQLENSGSIVGQVVLSDGMTPAVGATVALSIRGRYYLLSAEEDGGFDFDTIPMGSFTLFSQELFGPGTIERTGSLTTNNQVIDFGTLVLDDEDPFVVSIDPPAGTRDVPPLSTTPVIVFSEPIQSARLSPRSCGNWFELRRSADNRWLDAWCDWSPDGTTLTITPQQSLGSSTAYYVRITTNVIDLAGRHLPWNRRSTFYTADIIPPAVIDILPPNGADQVPVDSPVDILMSEPVRIESLSGNALQLDDLTTGASWSVTPDLRPGNRRIRLNPDVAMVPDREMQVTIQGLSDVAGNVMPQPVVTTFWTPDETPPVLSWVSPAEGAAFTAGDAIPASVTATDNRGVASVTFEIGEWSWTLTEPPYDQTVPAPITATAGPVTLRATVTDLFGNTTEGTRTLDLSPNPNTVSPSLTVDCLRPGDLVLAGKAIDLPIQVADDESVESVRLRVDGVEDQVVSPIFAASQNLVLSWAPPADAAPATSFVLTVEARDFAGNVTSQSVTVTTPATPPLQGGGDLDASVDGTDLVLDEGTWTALEPLRPSALTLLPGAHLVPATGATDGAVLDIAVTGRLQLRCGSTVDVEGLGYASGTEAEPVGGAPAWVDGSTPVAGGSHGGHGIPHPGRAGAPGGVFDSVYAPRLAGGGGSATADRNEPERGHGGGVVLLEADEIVLDGFLDARGRTVRHFQGAGAGGGVHLQAQTLRGIGSIDASGGRKDDAYPTCTSFYGSGGGGRVALDIGTLDGFDPATQVRATGGTIRESCGPTQLGVAAPGTVFVRTTADTYGNLRIDAGQPAEGLIPPATELPALGDGTVDQVTTDGSDLWIASGDMFLPRWLGVWVELEDGAGQSLGVFRVVDIDPANGLRLENAATASSATRFRGAYRFDGVELLGGASISATDPLSGAAFTLSGEVGLNGEFTASELTVTAGATVRPLAGNGLHFRVTGTMTVEPGAVIDVSGFGYSAGTEASPTGESPDWVAGSTPLAGGSHGGAGIPYPGHGGTGGEVFDSVYVPSLAGGGGAVNGDISNTLPEGDGGGVLVIEAGTLVLDGALHARGISTRHFHAPGAGGSIVVRADALTGSGTIDADGGSKTDAYPTCTSFYGAGGGGRVALDVGSFSGFDPTSQVTARGGTVRKSCSAEFPGMASAGTIYTRSSGDTYGHLRIDAGQPEGGLVPPATELPSLGGGAIDTQTVDGADLWITSAETLHPRWLGVWVELRDAADRSLGSFEVVEQSTDGLRLAGAGAVAGATTYRGEYRFDSLTLEGNAGLTSTDPVVGEQVVFDTDGPVPTEVVASSMVVKSGVRIWPQGDSLSLQVAGSLVVEPGAIIDVSGLGYAPGTEASPTGGAPDWVAGSSPLAGGSHGGTGVPYPGRTGTGGEAYDSVYAPALGGGGGSVTDDISNSLPKGYGAGVLTIEAGTLVLEGALHARGSSTRHRHSAGAGGSILVRAGSLTGSGTIDANGGSKDDAYPTCTSFYGAGGGGRVALDVGSFSGFDPTAQVTARGGTVRRSCSSDFPGIAGAGTIYTRTATDTYGHLRVDAGQASGGLLAPVTQLPTLGQRPIVEQTPEGEGLWVRDTEPFHPRWKGVWVELLDGTGGSLGSYQVMARSASQGLLLEGAASVSGATALRGEYRFDSVTVAGNAGLTSQDPLLGGDVVFATQGQVPDTVTASSLTVAAGAEIWPGGERLTLEVAGIVTVEATAIVDLRGRGYAAGTESDPVGDAPEWVSGSTPAAGGSHGGRGNVNTGGTAGEVYGSVYRPQLGGGGGALSNSTSNQQRGHGGGVLTVSADEVVLDGALWVSGLTTTSFFSAAGAAGSVLIEAGTLRGSGSISANGGTVRRNQCTSYGQGAGGGGRVALLVDALVGFDLASQVKVAGGEIEGGCNSAPRGFAGAGTIYTRTATDTYGHLRIDARLGAGSPVPTVTELPVLGGGEVVSATAEGTELRLAATSIFRPRWVGAWIELFDAAGVSLGSYSVASIDAAGHALLNDAAAATTAATYRGEYRFDTLELDGLATLHAEDPMVVTTLDLDAAATLPERVTADTFTLRAGVVAQPAGSQLHLTANTVILETGAILDAGGRGYPGGTTANPVGGAPEGVSGAIADGGGSHGGVGAVIDGGTPGEIYGSVVYPEHPGGGGAHISGAERGNGGGVLVIEATEVVLDGELKASGDTVPAGLQTGGAGGTVRVHAEVLRGSGRINATGGGTRLENFLDGAGGGGRVALWVDDLSQWDVPVQTLVYGGTIRQIWSLRGVGGTGTVFVFDANAVYGDLVVPAFPDPTVLPVLPTPLPVLGSGVVGTTTADPAVATDLWIEPADPNQEFALGVLGMWVRVDGVDYRVLDQTPDRRSLLLGDAAGFVATGDPFEGIYKFDSVVELYDAQVVAGDVLEIGGTASNTVLTVDDVSAVESAGQVTFTLTLTPPPTGDVAVAYQTVAETAEAGVDYVERSGTLTVPAGSTTHDLVVDLLDDTLDEPAETFRLVLGATVGASVGDGEAIATVLDDDGAPEVSIGDATVTEGDTTPVDLVFTLTLSTPSALPVSVDAQTADGTAVSGVDYVATQQTVLFAPGALEANLPVSILADTDDEPVETLVVDLTSASNASVLDDQGVGTVLDNDPPVPEIRVLDTSASEGDTLVSFGIELSEAGENDFVVDFATRDLSAVAGLDYFATSGSLVVPAGITSLTLPVALVDDTDVESEEQLALDLVAPAGTVLVDGTGVATLYDDDTPADFVEVAAEVGLALGQAKQGGFAFCDVDGDGDLDLLVNIDWNDPAGRSRLLFQEHGTYVDRTASHAAGLARNNLHRAALCGDVTGDGWPDLLRNGLDRIEVYANGGPDADPPFSFGTASADGPQSPTQVIDSLASGGPFTEGLGLLDVELDGDLDLIVENDAAGMALLLNDGDGTLVEAIPSAWGLPTSATHGDYLAVADYDADGRVDVLARRLGGADLFRNTDGGFVVEPSLSDETDLHNRGGVSFCDFDSDGDLDAFWTDAGVNQIWRNDAGTFVTTGEPEASAGVTVAADVDDAACGDVDLDGDVDLFLSTDNGPGFLFLNQTPTGGAFAFVADNRGIDLAGANGEAATFADVDLDGDLDLHVQVDFGANQLWSNPTNDQGAAHYLAVRALRCLPGGGLRDDLGARVRLIDPATALPVSPLLEISGGRGHGTQDPATVVAGLPLGSSQPVRVEVAFQGSNGQPGPVVHREVVPADLVGYRQVAVVDCTGVDQVPVAVSQVLGYQAGIELPITLGGRDPEGHPLSYELVSGPTHGTLSGEAPYLLYTPESVLEVDMVTFRVWDGVQPSATATITLEPPLAPFAEAAASQGLALGAAKQGGFVFCDVDADGDLDLMVNTDWNDPAGRTRLLFAEGGTYIDRTATHAAGLTRRNLHRSALCGDVTGDGWPDLIRNGLDRIEIYANGGPNATPAFSFGGPGVDGTQSPTQVIDSLTHGGPFTEGLGLLDANLDGALDLLVENDERGMALLLGDGSGTLVEADAATWGLPTSAIHGDYLAVGDYDVDGWVDFLARKQGGLDLYRNAGGTFVAEPSLDDETDLWNRGGVSFCDFDSDGDFDAVWTDAGSNQIWRNDAGTFVPTGEPTASSGVALPGDMDDAACGDVDLDGDLDLFLASASGPGYLFVNETPTGGALGFRRDNGSLTVGANGEAAVFADVDLDGTLDLYLQVDGGANQLWLGGATGESLVVEAKRCVVGAYRDDLGAVVRLFAADGVTPRSPVMEINGGRGHGTQDPARVLFGLPGGADETLIVEVRFLGDQGLPGPVIRQTVRPSEVSASAPAGYRMLTVRDQEVCP